MTGSSDIRILMTTDTVGGVWTYSCALASALAAAGVDVHLVTMGPRARTDQRAMLRDPRVRVVETDLALEWQDPAGQELANAQAVLTRLEARIRPDIVHLNSYREATFGWDAPTIVVAHSCVNSWARACRDTAWLNEPRWQRYTERVSAALNTAQAWVCPSRAFHDVIIDIYRPASAGVVIWNGIAPQTSRSRKQHFIFAAGRLWDRAKNIDVLAKAAPELHWPVLVAGPGEENAWSGLTWLGALSHSAVWARLQHASIFASPALYEPFGLTVLEAAAAGCALVLSDIPSFRELWSDAAVFVDPADSESLHRALADLSADDHKRAGLQRAAYEHSLTYSLTRMTDAYLRLYEGLLTPARAPAPAIEVHA